MRRATQEWWSGAYLIYYQFEGEDCWDLVMHLEEGGTYEKRGVGEARRRLERSLITGYSVQT